MDDNFDSPKLLIESAQLGIAELETEIESYVQQGRQNTGYELVSQTGEFLGYVQFPTPIPAKISMQIRSIAGDLRDALDHAVYASSVSIFGGEPENTKFLVAETEEKILKESKGKRFKAVHPDIVSFMIKENACRSGNSAVFSLSQFRNRNTHRAVLLANAGAGSIQLTKCKGIASILAMSEWRTTSHRLYFVRFSVTGPIFNLSLRPTIEVRAHPRFGTGDKSATSWLASTLIEVGRICAEIEKRTHAILRNK